MPIGDSSFRLDVKGMRIIELAIPINIKNGYIGDEITLCHSFLLSYQLWYSLKDEKV